MTLYSCEDAFDKIDSITPFERQKMMLELVMDTCTRDYKFNSFEEVHPYFQKMINTFRQMNYSEFKSEQFYNYEKEIKEIISQGGAE